MKISTILDNVEFGQLALPEFQRGYVWGRDQVRGLMSSLYRRYPVGSLLVWTTEAEASMTRGGSAAGVVKLLLDGQQRITSLYGIVKGAPPAFFQGNEKAFSDLYFDARSEVFEFYGPVKMRDDPLWISVTELFASEIEDLLQRLSAHSGDMKELVTYQARLGRLLQVRDIELHVEEITGKERSIDEVVEIFNRVNSGGTKLSAGDLALARICADWPEARAELRRLLAGWGDAGFDFRQEWLLRCATAIATNQAAFSALRTISVDEFATALKKAERAINFILNLVGDRLGIDHDRVLAGRYALAALARLVSDRGGSIEDPQLQQRLLYWYVNTFLWGRYSGSTETVLQRDLEAIARGGIDGLIDELNRWRGSLTVRPDDFDAWSVGARFYPLLYVLSRVGGARDLGNGLQLKAGMLGAANRLQLHHIFPKARLRAAGYGHTMVNAVANFCFLTAGSNLQISANDPMKYLSDIRDASPGVLESQWIPTDPALWHVDRYGDFLAARRQLLATAANDLLGSLLAGGQETVPLPAVWGVPVTEEPREAEFEEEPELGELVQLAARVGIAVPEVNFEIVDDESGEILALADVAWPNGIQEGRTEPVAFLLEPDEEMESRLGELGYRFFHTREHLSWHIEEVLGIDIDGDALIGEQQYGALRDSEVTSSADLRVHLRASEEWEPGRRSDARSWSHDEIREWVGTDFLRDLVDGFESWLESLPNCEVRHRVHSNHSVFSQGRRILFYYFARSWMYFRLPGATQAEIEQLHDLPGGVRVHATRSAVSGHIGSSESFDILRSVIIGRVGLQRSSVTVEEATAAQDDSKALERDFHRAMVQIYQKAQKEAGYTASYFMQMVSDRGGLATARALLASPQVSEGFTSLWERQRLDLSVEAHVLKPEFKSLFSEGELETARERLRQYGFRA
jgi:hypothetical protein